jgi:hypothetical protein
MPMPPDADPATPTPAEEAAPGPDAAPGGSTSWRRFLPRRRPAASAADGAGEPVEEATGVIPAPPRQERARALHRRRRALIAQRQEAVYHLGGLAFELYRRDLLGEEVMRRRAGEVAMLDDTVRDIDIRLGDMDRERRARRARSSPDLAAGSCVRCHASFRAEARFCWQCGARVVPESEGDEQVTAAIAPPP